ncbi:response regulator transcription factor [Hymenobacter sp. BT664]|uniref:Response regulator transcription factor n=1 Tax=Hymenobacter montanus TaxID=2771359 RepID=A0A927B950_9BACT|nr:LytTR family DNA-binding domain-containing protein [Hymenobacter montanus]MBD2766401.1 response regulator transcription factor [Hymenobacter montanus]
MLNSSISCIIVDDSATNRLILEQFVHLTDDVELLASLPDAVQLLPYLKNGPDLLLLDIEMPNLSGLDLVRLLRSPAPEVVLVTAHPRFAVDAFALPVADYLLKPLEYARFQQALALVRQRRARRRLAEPSEAPQFIDQQIFIRSNNKLVRLDLDQVLYIKAMSAYCIIATTTRKHIVHLTLKVLEERLPTAFFLRIHRSYIVNTRHIDSVAEGHLQLGSCEVPIGKSYEAELMQRLYSL